MIAATCRGCNLASAFTAASFLTADQTLWSDPILGMNKCMYNTLLWAAYSWWPIGDPGPIINHKFSVGPIINWVISPRLADLWIFWEPCGRRTGESTNRRVNNVSMSLLLVIFLRRETAGWFYRDGNFERVLTFLTHQLSSLWPMAPPRRRFTHRKIHLRSI